MPAGTRGVAGRLVATGAAALSLAVLADSSVEHYRGSFANKAMALPLATATISLIANSRRALGRRTDVAHATGLKLRGTGVIARLASAATALVGVVGTGFHFYNIGKQPGGYTLNNFFYKAPWGAPAALVLAGALGRAAQSLALRGPDAALGGHAGRKLGALTAAGLLGTTSEAAFLHFRGAYHNPAMWLPVTLPPIAATCLARDSLTGRPHRSSYAASAVVAALGLVGSAFHAFGVARNMGGWRNWRQNLLVGPPIPAPPAFTGIAIAGIGALLLMRREAAHG